MSSTEAPCAPLFAGAWEHTEIEGAGDPAPGALRVGAHWRWAGPLWRLDVPPGPLRLEGAIGRAELHRVAFRRAARMMRRSGSFRVLADMGEAVRRGTQEGALRDTFVVSDGRRFWPVSHVEGGAHSRRLVLFQGAVPPQGEDLWVISVEWATDRARPAGAVGFMPGTPVETPEGPVPIERLRTGDRVLTDAGPAPVRAVSLRKRTAALALPAGLFGEDVPARDVVIGPGTYLGLEGRALTDLWALDEALVRAADLASQPGVRELPETSLVSLVFGGAPLVMAGGLPYLAGAPQASGLRCLTSAEAQIALASDALRCGRRLVVRSAA
jgi:hypothetical protein